MLPFLSGFILALALIVPGVLVLYFKRAAGMRLRHDASRRELEELGKLTGGLAHEIKNPLSTIKINLKLISEDSELAESKSARLLRKLSVLQKETERLEQILDDFLRYIGRTEIHPVPTDINELLNEMVDFYSPQAGAHSVMIRLGPAEGPIVCRIDADMVKQSILNLFINAQQAMPSGGEIIIRTGIRKKTGIIAISDTGIGIGPEKLERIFEAYYTSRPGGSGLGLPAALKIIEAHNGSITVNSEVGKGTCFTISLPLKADED